MEVTRPHYSPHMGDGDEKHWWSHWWIQTENAVVPWAVATMAVLLAIGFAVAAGIQLFELRSHHIVIPTDPKGPNWAEILTAVLTALLALIAVFALGTINEAKNARVEARRAQNALQMNELSRRWDEKTNLEVRRKVHD